MDRYNLKAFMVKDHTLHELISDLSSTDEADAHSAVCEIMRRLPMTALPERWIDNSNYEKPARSHVPEWLTKSGTDWDSGSTFLNLCADQAEMLKGQQLDLFFTRLAALLGITRLFAKVLRERRLNDLATRFVLRLTHTRMLQFPLQLCFSPTLRCQLECPYCISAGTADKKNPEPAEQDVDTLLEWLEKQSIKRLGLSGGEPTLSPLFPYIADTTRQRGISLYMASNGIFSREICEKIINRNVASITLHLTVETLRDPAKKKVFDRNVFALVNGGIKVALRCNLTDTEQDPTVYAEYAREFDLDEIRVAVPTPNAQHRNTYIEPEALKEFAEHLTLLHQACAEYAIKLNLAKPFPLCLLPEQTARYFLGNGSAAINCPMHQNEFSNNIVVHPDLSFIPCLGLSMKQYTPITHYDNLRKATETFDDLIMPLIMKPLFQHCPECPLWKGSRCIGACLSYRLPEGSGLFSQQVRSAK